MDEDSAMEGGVQSSPHHPHRLPSVIAHRRGVPGCQVVVVVGLRHGTHASLPLLSGQDLDWVGGLLSCCSGVCDFPTSAHGEPRYDIGPSDRSCCSSHPTESAVPPAGLLGAWATSELFPAASVEIFSFPATWSIRRHTHTFSHTNTRAHIFYLSCPRTSHPLSPHEHADWTSIHTPPPPTPSSALARMLQKLELSFSVA